MRESRLFSELITLFGDNFTEKKGIELSAVDYIFDSSMGLFGKEVIVVSDEDVLTGLIGKSGAEGIKTKAVYLGFDSVKKIEDQQMNDVRKIIQAEFGDDISIQYKEEERSYFYSILGGAFFVGIFLAILFLNMIVIVDTLTFFLAIIAVSIVFVAVYTFVYKLTSKQYYNIVGANGVDLH